MQEYLTDLNTMYEEHMVESEDYSTRITTLEEQMATVLEKLQNVSTDESANIEEITSEIATINQNLETISNELAELKAGSSTTIAQIDEKIISLEATDQEMQDDISVNSTNISTIMTTNADMQTSLNNLTSTQNSLTTTQSNLSSTVTGINSRLTSLEANVDAITGGVDLAELNTKVQDLEEESSQKCIVKNSYSMYLNVTPTTPLYSLYYYYKTSTETCVVQKFHLKYTSSGAGTLTAKLLQNGVEVDEYVIDLSANPSQFKFEYIHNPNSSHQNFQFLFSTTENVYFDELDVVLIGSGVELFETDRDLKVCCFDNKVYVTKYDNHEIKTGLMGIDECSIDASLLTNPGYNYMDTARVGYYGPKMVSYSNIVGVTQNNFVTEDAKDNRIRIGLISDTGEVKYSQKAVENFSTNMVIDTYTTGIGAYIENCTPRTVFTTSAGTSNLGFTYLSDYKDGNWYFATAARSSYYINNVSTIVKRDNSLVFAYHEDGYIYAINSFVVKGITRVGKGGKYLTAYYQEDGSCNVYINHFNRTEKYTLTPSGTYTYDCIHVETIEDCDCFYELKNNKYIKHTSSGWELVDESEQGEITTE